MTPFNPNAKCPKCGEIGAKHFPPTNKNPSEMFWIDRIHHSGRLAKQEHIVRSCDCCGYSWPEAPMDKNDE